MSGLRIGELATLAQTTTRAIRHYHAIGLLPEPDRDASGYRRYGPESVVRLVRIRRLRALGMPLEQVATTLDADASEPLRALAGELDEEIERLRALRERVLAAADAPEPAQAWAEMIGAARRGAARASSTTGAAPLPSRERDAAQLVDALDPTALPRAAALAGDPRLTALLRRFATVTDEEADALAEELAAVIPRPIISVPTVAPGTVAALAGNRLSPAQRHCMERVRARLLEPEA